MVGNTIESLLSPTQAQPEQTPEVFYHRIYLFPPLCCLKLRCDYCGVDIKQP